MAQTTLEDYRAMVDDEQRTAAYAAAIQRRAKGATVADVGTGPFALLAVLAVKFGTGGEVWSAEGLRHRTDA